MAELTCPECGCSVRVDAYEVGGITYCCKPCATSGGCECGCCETGDSKEWIEWKE